MTEHGRNFQMQLPTLIEAHLTLLQENVWEVFHCWTKCRTWCWFLDIAPFYYYSFTAETNDLIDLQSDFGLKAFFKERPHTEFRVHLLNVPEYRSIAKKAFSVLIPIAAASLCKSVFSCLCEIKFDERNSITRIDPLMREAIKKDIISRFGMLVDNTQQQKKSLKIFFWICSCSVL